jgi:hypothetical protein
MTYFRRRRIFAMYALAAREPFTNRAFERRAALRRLRGATLAFAFRLRRRALRIPPREPLAFAAISFAAAVCWPQAVVFHNPPM